MSPGDAAAVRVRTRPAPRQRLGAAAAAKPGTALEQEQVSAIVHLVASSIPGTGCHAGHRGRSAGTAAVLARSQRRGRALREQQFDVAHRLEDNYTQRIEELLDAAGRRRPGARAGGRELDWPSVTRRRTSNTSPTARSCAASRSQSRRSRDSSGAGGVPGRADQSAAGRRASPAPRVRAEAATAAAPVRQAPAANAAARRRSRRSGRGSRSR